MAIGTSFWDNALCNHSVCNNYNSRSIVRVPETAGITPVLEQGAPMQHLAEDRGQLLSVFQAAWLGDAQLSTAKANYFRQLEGTAISTLSGSNGEIMRVPLRVAARCWRGSRKEERNESSQETGTTGLTNDSQHCSNDKRTSRSINDFGTWHCMRSVYVKPFFKNEILQLHPSPNNQPSKERIEKQKHLYFFSGINLVLNSCLERMTSLLINKDTIGISSLNLKLKVNIIAILLKYLR